MDLALGSAAGSHDVDLHAAAFECAVEPTLLLDPHADLILDANPAACSLLGYDRALLRQTRASALASPSMIEEAAAAALKREAMGVWVLVPEVWKQNG